VFVSLTRVSTVGLSLDVPMIVADELQRWLEDLEGFQGFLMLSREGSSIAISFWESREAAERHRVARSQVRERVTELAGGTIEEVVEYDVAYAQLGPLVIDPDV
jgi:heme-degrading monooxygenase HmoA